MININFSPRSVMVTGSILAALVCITLFYSILQWHQDWVLAHKVTPSVTVKPDTSSQLIASIPDEHIFGQSLTTEVPLTNLQLRVTGIVKEVNGQNEQLSKAYISMSGQPSKIYKIGDNLTEGVKIYGITTDAVILEHNGRLEKLPLPREQLQFKPRVVEER